MNGLLSNGSNDIRRGTNILPTVSRATATTRLPTAVSVIGVREMLTSLGLLCLVSLMMALLALLFLLKMNPPPDVIHFDQVRIYIHYKMLPLKRELLQKNCSILYLE